MEVTLEKLNDVVCCKCELPFNVQNVSPLAAVACPHCHAGNTVHAQIGDMLIVELIGVGGMGLVYRALDLPLQRQVAVKLIKGHSHASMERSVNEAQAQARLSHPNVAQIHAIHTLGNQPVIVMELINGGRLSQLISKSDRLEEGRALTLATQIAGGLHAARKAGLVFGDVKPSNILLDSSGVAKLADFGLSRDVEAKVNADGSGMNASSSTAGFGTAAYVAPEVVARKGADHRSDIYSLGVTLFQLLTGELPFVGASKAETIAARMDGIVPQVRFLREDVHTRTNDVVFRMMAFKPDARYQDYGDLIADLELANMATQSDALAELVAGPSMEAQTHSENDTAAVVMKAPPSVSTRRVSRWQSAATALFRSASAISPWVNRMLGAQKPAPAMRKIRK